MKRINKINSGLITRGSNKMGAAQNRQDGRLTNIMVYGFILFQLALHVAACEDMEGYEGYMESAEEAEDMEVGNITQALSYGGKRCKNNMCGNWPSTSNPIVGGSGAGDNKAICDFAIYSREYTDLRDRVSSLVGDIGTAGQMAIGVNSNINGNLESVGDVWLRNYALIDGNATTGGQIHFQHGAKVMGDIEEHDSPVAYTIPSKTVRYGTRDVFVYRGQNLTLSPGQYNEIHAYAGSSLTLTAGEYNARKLIIESSSVTLRLDIAQGPVEINVDNELRFGDRMTMRLIGGDDPGQVRFYSNYSNQVSIGTDLSFYGVLEVPHGELYVFSRNEIHGGLFARRIVVDTDVRITGTGCEDPCEGVVCDDPPADSCVDQITARVYESAGTCEDGVCDYSYTDYHCAFGCEDGSCRNDPCEDVVCDDPPADSCVDQITARVYESAGTCEDGVCDYQYTDYHCHHGCENGACRSDSCDDIVCEDPPADSCVDQITARVYESTGICEDGVCGYQYTDYHCSRGCENGSCRNDPCDDIVCEDPPADSCMNPFIARVYESTGICEEGVCNYQYTDHHCTYGCENGSCLDDPCDDIVCEDPPADTCVNPYIARVYENTGICEDGTCDYQYTDHQCPYGCKNGSCLNDSCEDVVCDDSPADTCVNPFIVRVYESAGTCEEGTCNYQYSHHFCRYGCRNGACNNPH